jgi:hypothetical protein
MRIDGNGPLLGRLQSKIRVVLGTDAVVLNALATRSGGEVISPDDY